MKPAPALTRRKQFDYSDVITSSLGRAWAQADPQVVFVENPHSQKRGDHRRIGVAEQAGQGGAGLGRRSNHADLHDQSFPRLTRDEKSAK